jgi:predicted acetyltransferase
MFFAWEMRILHVPSVCLFVKSDSFQNDFNICKKVKQKIDFTGEVLNEGRQRILNGESRRKVTAALGTKESTLRKRMKALSAQ